MIYFTLVLSNLECIKIKLNLFSLFFPFNLKIDSILNIIHHLHNVIGIFTSLENMNTDIELNFF